MPDSDALSKILRRDPRYRREAYDFVEQAVRAAHGRAGERRHVTPRELLDAFRVLARSEFGPLAQTVLAEWGLRTTDDVGNVVFNLVDADEMGKTEDDDVADFHAVYDFAEVFPSGAGPVRLRRRHKADDEEE